jgi:hypothetical protein
VVYRCTAESFTPKLEQGRLPALAERIWRSDLGRRERLIYLL